MLHSLGILPRAFITLEVMGRKSGKTIRFPLAMVITPQGERYLVSMLGKEANWVKNVLAAGGQAVIHRGRREPVQLRLVTPEQRAPLLKAYLRIAPGARPHVPVHYRSPVADFERIAADYPVFEVLTLKGHKN